MADLTQLDIVMLMELAEDTMKFANEGCFRYNRESRQKLIGRVYDYLYSRSAMIPETGSGSVWTSGSLDKTTCDERGVVTGCPSEGGGQ